MARMVGAADPYWSMGSAQQFKFYSSGVATLGGKVSFTAGLFIAESAGAVADTAAYGQYWVKNTTPNEPWFTGDTGVDQQIMTADYAGIYVEGNGGATTINLVQSFEQVAVFDTDMPEVISNGVNGTDSITIGATAIYKVQFHMSALGGGANKVYEITAMALATSGSTITGVTQATPGVVTATAHGFSNGDLVKITGIVGMTELNGRIFTVTNKADNTFELEDDNGTDIATGGFAAYSSGGTATLATPLDQVHADRKWSANDVGQLSGGGLVSLTKDETLELWVKGVTDSTDITVETCQFFMERVS